MELSVDEDKLKDLLKDIMVDIIKNRKGEFYQLILEALEEVALAEAIKEGRRDKYIDEERIMNLLESSE